MTSPGNTRTRVAARHALIAPDGHVASNVPGISGVKAVVLISEGIGAKFAQLLLTFERGGRAGLTAGPIETVGYFMSGGATVRIGSLEGKCSAGGYFFAPAGETWSITAPKAGTQVTLFEKRFVPLAGEAPPAALIGAASRIKGQPFLGDPDARLQVLLPDAMAYDLAVNVFTFKPGAALPFVETHIMEHGLIMLAGQGEYRLEDARYAVSAGDVIWMAPYCPQWFAASGKRPASYLYYKDVNRPVL